MPYLNKKERINKMAKGREILWEKVDKLVKDIREGRPVLEILRGKYTEAQIREAEKKLQK